jgi:hypothetical protein
LLGLRFFFDCGVLAGERSMGRVTTVVRVRLEERVVDAGDALDRFRDADEEAAPYWNFDRLPPKDGVAGGGVAEVSSVGVRSGGVEARLPGEETLFVNGVERAL